jgi:hypothetical protein
VAREHRQRCTPGVLSLLRSVHFLTSCVRRRYNRRGFGLRGADPQPMPISRTTSSRSGQARVAPNLQDLLIVLAGKLIGQWLTGSGPAGGHVSPQ